MIVILPELIQGQNHRAMLYLHYILDQLVQPRSDLTSSGEPRSGLHLQQSPSQLSHIQINPAQVTTTQVSLAQVSTQENSTEKVRPGQVSIN
jgi:hypothetical protein